MSKFLNHFISKWYKYLFALILAIVLWILLIDLFVAPKKNEKIGIFIGSYGMSEKINEAITKPDYLREINFYDVNINESYYFILFSSYASSGDFDMAIVAESQFRESDIQYYEKINQEKFEGSFGVFDYYRVNDDIYGVKVYDSETNQGILTDYIAFEDEGFEEDYYLFFSNSSIHLGPLNDSQYDGLYEILKELLNKE